MKPHRSSDLQKWNQPRFHHVLNFSCRDREVFGYVLFAPVAFIFILIIVHNISIESLHKSQLKNRSALATKKQLLKNQWNWNSHMFSSESIRVE